MSEEYRKTPLDSVLYAAEDMMMDPKTLVPESANALLASGYVLVSMDETKNPELTLRSSNLTHDREYIISQPPPLSQAKSSGEGSDAPQYRNTFFDAAIDAMLAGQQSFNYLLPATVSWFKIQRLGRNFGHVEILGWRTVFWDLNIPKMPGLPILPTGPR